VHVVICGRPNAGKSSLLNALLKTERSIVTPLPGTTRDTIEEVLDIKGIPVRIVDTAGILRPRGLIEKHAVRRAEKEIALAELVILLFDGSKKLNRDDKALMAKLKKKTTLAVINKIDIRQKIERDFISRHFTKIVPISAKNNTNIHLLEEVLVAMACGGTVNLCAPLFVANLRQAQEVKKAQKLIAEARNSVDNKLFPELIAQDLKEALGFLDELLGKKFSQEILDKIFSEFCIGK
jgi:tRNA modification GTPase